MSASLRDRNLRMALLKAIADAVQDALKAERATHMADLIERYEDEGTKSFDVKLPSGTKVATISLSIPKDAVEVVDPDGLAEWAKDHDMSLIRERHVPAVPAHTVVELDPKRVAELLKRAKPMPGDTQVVDGATGELVDGLALVVGGTPKSFSVRYTDDGRTDLGDAYRAGALDHLVGNVDVLPQIGGDAS